MHTYIYIYTYLYVYIYIFVCIYIYLIMYISKQCHQIVGFRMPHADILKRKCPEYKG